MQIVFSGIQNCSRVNINNLNIQVFGYYIFFLFRLSEHKKGVHEKRKSHVCSICQKTFGRSTQLSTHMCIHTGERPHICHYCGKGFSNVCYYSAYVKIFFVNNICILQAQNMKAHISMRHEPIKTLFMCDMCDYSTKHRNELKLHIMKHNGEKPFKCPKCHFKTSKKYTLKLHMYENIKIFLNHCNGKK